MLQYSGSSCALKGPGVGVVGGTVALSYLSALFLLPHHARVTGAPPQSWTSPSQGHLQSTEHHGGHIQKNPALSSPHATGYLQPHLRAPLNLLFNKICPLYFFF